MSSKFVIADDKGICEFCGQPVDKYETELFIRRVEEDEARVCHEECYFDYLAEEQ